jgi:hypothetical protein
LVSGKTAGSARQLSPPRVERAAAALADLRMLAAKQIRERT